MNRRKAAFSFCITPGMIIDGVLAMVNGALLLGVLVGASILGALGFLAIDAVVSQRRTTILPYDQLDEHHLVSNLGHHRNQRHSSDTSRMAISASTCHFI